ncbi:MAG: SurA N-terminal domain-containing protein [Magnetococcales bacterium]|nr:SurA N-terminal domain-containing protein [Magnetococcales bacterium]
MLNVLRQSANTLIVKILMLLLTMSFMVWGVESYIEGRKQLPVVEASGWSIGPQEFSEAYENEYQRMRERFGPSLDKKTAEMLGLKMRTLNGLISRRLVLAAATDLRLTVSPDMLRRLINDNPAFQENGQFDKERYNVLLLNSRMTPREFENQLIADLIAEQIRRITSTIVAMPKALLEDIYYLENEKRIAAILTLQPGDLEETIQASDEELAAYLKKNIQRFMTAAQVKVNYAVLNADSVRAQVTVSPEEGREFYNEHLKEYQKAETRKVRHLLARVDDKTSAAAAMEKIQTARERLKKGETFAAVAKALSDDATAGEGGDLGEFGLGVMDPAFEKVAFSQEAGKVSEPVTTEFGVHLILVERIMPAETKPFEKVVGEINGRIVEGKAKDLVYERSVTLEDQLYASGNLKSISTDLNMRYKETGLFSRDDPKLTGVEQDEKFLNAAFSTAKGSLSGVIETGNHQFVALEVVERQEPAPKSLEQARDEVSQAYKKDRAREEAQKIMGEVVKGLNEGKPLDQLAALHARIRSATTQPFTQDGAEKEPGPLTREAVFRRHAGKPNHPELIEEEGALLAVRLLKVVEAEAAGFKAAEPELLKKMENTLGQEQLASYINGLWARANIRIHQEILDRL